MSAVFIRADDGTVDKHRARRDISVVRPTIDQDTDGILLPPFRQDMHEETCCSLQASSGLHCNTFPRACPRSEEHTSELQSHLNLVCRLLLEKKKKRQVSHIFNTSYHIPG